MPMMLLMMKRNMSGFVDQINDAIKMFNILNMFIIFIFQE
jgi:hypothetical protein